MWSWDMTFLPAQITSGGRIAARPFDSRGALMPRSRDPGSQRPRYENRSHQFEPPADNEPETAATGLLDLQRPATLCQSPLQQHESHLEVVVDLRQA